MSLAARQMLTVATLAAGIMYMIPSIHQKYNVEKYFGKTISDETAQHIGWGLVAGAILLNAQPQYTVYHIKELDFLSPERRRVAKSVENFCGFMDSVQQPRMQPMPSQMMPGSDLSF